MREAAARTIGGLEAEVLEELWPLLPQAAIPGLRPSSRNRASGWRILGLTKILAEYPESWNQARFRLTLCANDGERLISRRRSWRHEPE